MSERITLELVQQADYRFEVHFDEATLPPLVTDEPPPLGGGCGPDPVRLLGTAVANCLAASLLFALRKFKNQAEPMRTVASVQMARNAQNRLRIERIDVDITLGASVAELRSLDRVLGQFEDFCTVTQSVRPAIVVDVRVIDRDGRVLTPAPADTERAALA
ncbi:MAG TPA: OsmC family protein [Burkholderiaceae bacterium]|nr:OsmC family protein [Burkholderiaceae bacterium]